MTESKSNDTGTPRSVYGSAERARLQVLADKLRAGGQTPAVMLAPAIADALRQDLPDISDTDIGRVLVALGTDRFTALFSEEGSLVWTVLVNAGLQLTETEWKDDLAWSQTDQQP